MTQRQLNFSLIKFSRNGNLAVVKLLVGKGANIHAWDSAPLAGAAWGGHLDIVKYLLKNVSYKRVDIDYAEHYASINVKLRVVEYLKRLRSKS